MFSGHGSWRVKFETEICKFNFKFKCKTIRQSVFSSDEAAASEAEGAGWSSVTEADWAGNEVWRKKTSR